MIDILIPLVPGLLMIFAPQLFVKKTNEKFGDKGNFVWLFS